MGSQAMTKIENVTLQCNVNDDNDDTLMNVLYGLNVSEESCQDMMQSIESNTLTTIDARHVIDTLESTIYAIRRFLRVATIQS